MGLELGLPAAGLSGFGGTRQTSTPASRIDPLDLNPYLYFKGDTNVSVGDGPVHQWYAKWYGGSAPSNGLSKYLTQTTADLKPTHSATNKKLTFDVVTDKKDKMVFDSGVEQAGVLVTATSNGIFSYEVDADEVTEITALGNQTGYYQALDLYAYILFPSTIAAVDLAGVVRWLDENTGATKNPVGSLASYWKYRMDVVTPKFDNLDFSGVTSVQNAWQIAWGSSGGITSFPSNIDLSNCTNFSGAWYNTLLTTFPVLDVSSGTTFNDAWVNTTIVDFPALAFPEGTSFLRTWSYAYSTHSFGACTFSLDPDDDINFSEAWRGHSNAAFTSFPALNLSRGTNFTNTWNGCNKLTSFPAITFSTTASDNINFTQAWRGCTALTSFPALNLSRATGLNQAWDGCTSLTSFPAVTFSTTASDNLDFGNAWNGCTGLTSFPALNLSRGTEFSYAWRSCTNLTSFPAVTFSSDAGDSLSFSSTWASATSLASFPSDIDMSRASSCGATWNNTRIVSFPALDLSNSTHFAWCWGSNTSMVSFGACNMNAGRLFNYGWQNNTALTTFPAGVFDDWAPASVTTDCFLNTWDGCTALTEQSVENILLSISASGQWATSTGTSSGTVLAGKEITIDSNNVNVDNLSASNRAACTALQSRGWEVVINGSVVSEYALSFNGTDERVEFSTPTPFSGQTLNTFDCTLSAWAKYDTIAQYEAIICLGAFDLEIAPTSTTEVGIWVDNAAYGGAVYAPTMGVWNHYVATKSGNTYTLYVNGVQIGQNDDADNATVGVTSFIGNNSESNYLDGDIDEVAIWDEALDAAAVLAVYNAGSPINLNRDKGNYDNASDIVSWWRMGDSDSGAGNFVTDVIATDGEALHLPGIAANYASVPDAADLDGFGDFTLELTDVTMPDWSPLAAVTLISKYGGGQVAWKLDLQTDDTLRLYSSADGSAESNNFSVATSLGAGATASIRVLRIGEVVRFYLDTGSGFAQLGSDSANTVGTLFNSTSAVEVGAYAGGAYTPLLGSLTRARIWSDATQTTNALDINFALANKGETSFTATSGQVVTVHSTAIDNPAAIRSATDGVLVNTPTFVVDNPPNYSDYSVDFDGTNQYADCGTGLGDALGDNYAGSLTFSMWFKSDDTSVTYRGLFTMGAFAGDYGEVRVSISNNVLAFYLGGLPLPYSPWYRSVAFTDTGWNHVALVYAVGSEANSKMYLNGVATGATTGTFPVAADMDFAGLKTIIGGYYSTSYTFNGLMDEVAIWNSALTSAQINDIYNGGVPAALADSPIGWWRLGENNAGTGITITDQGSGTNNATLYNTPTFSRSVPAEDATWNNRSLSFAASSSEHMTTTADDTLATKSYSFWAKSDDTSQNGLFHHGGDTVGSFMFNGSGVTYPFLGIGASIHRAWVANSAQDDDAFHHWVVYIEHDDITNCKLYCDGVLQAVQATTNSGSANAYTTGLRIGHNGGSHYFEGNLDEFAVFDGELSPSQVLQIYNGGKPASLKEHSPESWWRMGDMDDAGGTTIRDLGVVSTTELITGFTNGSTYPLDTLTTSGRDISAAIETTGNWGGCVSNALSLTAGEVYEVSFNLTYTSGTDTMRINLVKEATGASESGGGGVLSTPYYTNTSGGHTSFFVVTATDSVAYLQLGTWHGADEINFSATDISLKKADLVLNGGFSNNSVPTTWNGSSAVNLVGWTNNSQVGGDHTAVAHVTITDGALRLETNGDYVDISQDIFTVGSVYEYSLEITARAAGQIIVYGGGVDLTGNISTVGVYTGHFTATTATHFYIKRVSGATDVTFDNVSFKQVNGNPATLVNTPTFSTDTP